MTGCLDRTSPRCVLPTEGSRHVCPICRRVWKREAGAWWHRGERTEAKPQQ
jgi:hypothetical protein